MANLLDIRRRIKSVKNTQQITKAMKMVAAAKLRRSQDRILATRPYALELRRVVANLASRIGSGSGDEGSAPHPLLASRPESKVLLLVVTGDRGLAGSFNATVLRRVEEVRKGFEAPELLLLGKKGADYYNRRKVTVRGAHRDLFSRLDYDAAEAIAEDVISAYAKREYDAVYVVYNEFKSVIQQTLQVERLLPLDPEAVSEGAGSSLAAASADYVYEPSPSMILSDLLPRYVAFQVYRVLLESQAAEHAARMTAMDSATKNAGEMIDKLTLTYNRARQAAITTELIEVVSGASALEG